jgi:ABC-type dipeptide/oligopeptide/nickel transport system permease subunit
VIGVVWGAVAGYLGGRWDSVMMRFVDILYSMPSIVFVIVLIAVLEEAVRGWLTRAFSSEAGALANLLLLFAGLGAVSWLTMARIVRGQVLSLRTRAFVDASRVLGASHTRILFRHILPNVYGVILVYLTLTIPAVILYESFLSYLGLGIQPPQASLGYLIADGASQINSIRIYWWLIVFPGSTLAVTLLALNFLGDGLRDALDPRASSS